MEPGSAETTDTGYRYDAAAFRGVFERDFGYLAGVERNVGRFGSRPALSSADGSRSWTYAELWRDVERLAGALAAQGTRPGDPVVFQLFNGPEFALAWLAALRLGAVAVPINFRFSAGETAHVLADSAPVGFVFDADLEGPAREALEISAHAPPGRRSPAARTTASRGCSPPAPSRRPRLPATSTPRRPASTPRAPPGCRRGSRSTTWSR